MIVRAVWLFASLLFAQGALAQGQPEALSLLGRAVSASQRTSYIGTFVYQSGSNVETSRVAHYVDTDGNSVERLEVLDGSPREVIRVNDEVRCYLPKEKIIIEDRRGARKTFPSLLPESVGALSDYYTVRKGPPGRVAGFDTQSVLLEPKDGYRYGHMFWIEAQTGLLLKARMVNERGEAIEQFAFAQLEIGLPLSRDDVRSRMAVMSEGWAVHSASTTTGQNVDVGWVASAPVPSSPPATKTPPPGSGVAVCWKRAPLKSGPGNHWACAAEARRYSALKHSRCRRLGARVSMGDDSPSKIEEK